MCLTRPVCLRSKASLWATNSLDSVITVTLDCLALLAMMAAIVRRGVAKTSLSFSGRIRLDVLTAELICDPAQHPQCVRVAIRNQHEGV